MARKPENLVAIQPLSREDFYALLDEVMARKHGRYPERIVAKIKGLGWSNVGRMLGVSPQHVFKWIMHTQVPAEYVEPLARVINEEPSAVRKVLPFDDDGDGT